MPVTPETTEALLTQLHRLGRAGKWVGGRRPLPQITVAGAALLAHLVRDGESRCGDIADFLGVDASVVSRQLADLERRGFAARRPDPHDGRAALAYATEHGRALLADLRDHQIRAVADQLRDWDDDDVARLVRTLHHLENDLQRESVADPRPREANA